MQKTPNHLGTRLEKQASTISKLPPTLRSHIDKLQTATVETKQTLKDCLPEEVLETLYVVKVNNEHLTLSVVSLTAANHINYMKTEIMRILKKDSTMFKNLLSMQVIVR